MLCIHIANLWLMSHRLYTIVSGALCYIFSSAPTTCPFTSQEGQLNLLRAPMPGVVKSISCEVGDSVEEGTTIVVLEAMKMQNPLFAPMTGRVCIQHVECTAC